VAASVGGARTERRSAGLNVHYSCLESLYTTMLLSNFKIHRHFIVTESSGVTATVARERRPRLSDESHDPGESWQNRLN